MVGKELKIYALIIYGLSTSLGILNLIGAHLSFQEQHFINDTIRSEFHRRFMDKYVK